MVRVARASNAYVCIGIRRFSARRENSAREITDTKMNWTSVKYQLEYTKVNRLSLYLGPAFTRFAVNPALKERIIPSPVRLHAVLPEYPFLDVAVDEVEGEDGAAQQDELGPLAQVGNVPAQERYRLGQTER